MSLSKGTAAPTSFSISGGDKLTQEEIREALAKNKFTPVDKEKARYLAVGWIDPRKPHVTITDAIPAHDGLVMSFRIDAVRVPAKDIKFELNKFIDEYLKETGRAKVTKLEKMEMREQVLEDLRYVTQPTRTIVHVYWDWNRQRMLVQPCSTFVESCLVDLVHRSFGMELVREGVTSELVRIKGDEEGRALVSSFEADAFTHRFLSWLHWRIRDEGFITVKGRRVNLYFTDDVTLQRQHTSMERVRVIGENVMDSPVMVAAMSADYVPVQAKCEVSFDEDVVTAQVLWDPLTWKIKGLRPPKYKGKSSFERIQLRTELFSDLYDLRTNLFEWFLQDEAHTDEGWEKIWTALLED